MRSRLQAQQRSNRNTAAPTISVHTLNRSGILLINMDDKVYHVVTEKSHNLNSKTVLTNILPDRTHPDINCCVKTNVLWEIRKSGITVTSKTKGGLKRKKRKTKSCCTDQSNRKWATCGQTCKIVICKLWASKPSSSGPIFSAFIVIRLQWTHFILAVLRLCSVSLMPVRLGRLDFLFQRGQTVLPCIIPPTPFTLADHQIGLASLRESIILQHHSESAGKSRNVLWVPGLLTAHATSSAERPADAAPSERCNEDKVEQTVDAQITTPRPVEVKGKASQTRGQW